MYASDTITAIATPPGTGGVAIVRISGNDSIAILARLFRSARPASSWATHQIHFGVILSPSGDELDRGLAVIMRAPRSYTGEDVAEIHCHGGVLLARRVFEAVLACGARSAEAGEFTKRAFLNGKLDLVQAEAVIDAVSARSTQAADVAVRQLSGAVSRYVNELRDQVIRLKALLEAQIDFSEEDFTIEPAQLLDQLAGCEGSLASLQSTYRQGKIIRDGLRIAIVGKPNVGKSSLLNCLLGEDRAIVTPLAGTTRDVIEEALEIEGLRFVVADTAGLRDHHEAEVVEKIGMQRTMDRVREADLVLIVLDQSNPTDGADAAVLQATADVPRIIVLNKADLPTAIAPSQFEGERRAVVSATEHSGLDPLRRLLVETADVPPIAPDHPIITRSRHRAALDAASQSLALARGSIVERRPADVIAVDVQDALDYLGAITGAVTSEDVLDRVFQEFCVGK